MGHENTRLRCRSLHPYFFRCRSWNDLKTKSQVVPPDNKINRTKSWINQHLIDVSFICCYQPDCLVVYYFHFWLVISILLNLQTNDMYGNPGYQKLQSYLKMPSVDKDFKTILRKWIELYFFHEISLNLTILLPALCNQKCHSNGS